MTNIFTVVQNMFNKSGHEIVKDPPPSKNRVLYQQLTSFFYKSDLHYVKSICGYKRAKKDKTYGTLIAEALDGFDGNLKSTVGKIWFFHSIVTIL